MQNENLIINMATEADKAEMIIREVNYVNELEVKEPVKLCIYGTIGAPYEFLQRRISEIDQINQKRCHILVSRQGLSIDLVTNENDYYNQNKVTGKLISHPKFIEFGINSGRDFEPAELGQFFKMNRVFFADRSENMKIVSLLKSFTATVNTSIEKEKNQNGSFNDTYTGVVNSNLPGAFKLKMPLFKGRPAEEFEVEIYANVNGRTVSLQLFSPGAVQALEEIRDAIIDEQIGLIRELAPEIAIIEQ